MCKLHKGTNIFELSGMKLKSEIQKDIDNVINEKVEEALTAAVTAAVTAVHKEYAKQGFFLAELMKHIKNLIFYRLVCFIFFKFLLLTVIFIYFPCIHYIK